MKISFSIYNKVTVILNLFIYDVYLKKYQDLFNHQLLHDFIQYEQIILIIYFIKLIRIKMGDIDSDTLAWLKSMKLGHNL